MSSHPLPPSTEVATPRPTGGSWPRRVHRGAARSHCPAFLSWGWRFPDFKLIDVVQRSPEETIATFRPRRRPLIRLLTLARRRPPRLSMLCSLRLASLAGCIGTGLAIERRGDLGEPSAGEVQVRFNAPLELQPHTCVPVRVVIRSRRASFRSEIYEVEYFLGEHEEHIGAMSIFYPRITEPLRLNA